MDKSALQKYETQLAVVWRLWTQFQRYSKLALKTNPRHFNKLFEIAKLYASNRRFWATNNPKYLARALTSYYSLRVDWLNQEGKNFEASLEVSGWADRASFLKIREALSAYSVRRVFRPDVWYLKGGSGSFFSGFIIQAPTRELSAILRSLEKAVPDFEMNLPQNPISKLPPKSAGRLESINPLQSERGLNWFSTFHISPRELTWLVEATSDREVSDLALSFFMQFGDFAFDGETLRCIAKYCLLLGFIPDGIEVKGWSLNQIKRPEWVPIGSGTASAWRNENSKVDAKYFQAENVSVTNGGIVLTADGFLDWDSAQSPVLDFVAGNHNSVIGSSANSHVCFVRDVQSGEELVSAILLGSRVDSNWFHFLIETLPRLLVVEDLLDKSIPVLVSSRVPRAGLEALRLITNRQIIQVDPELSTLVRKAYVPGPVIYHPDTQFLWGSEKLNIINFELLRSFREKVLESVGSETGSEKAFWPRFGGSRVASNSKKIQRLLSRRGFEIQNIGSLKFVDQVRLIRSCFSLITEGGASMSNFIFLPKGARILVLMSNQSKSYMMPKLLASLSQSEVRIESGQSMGEKFFLPLSSRLQASYRVNLRTLKKTIGDYFIK
jgi:hypothetical protein